MTTFVDAVQNQEARTENGMKARQSTANACVDLFFKLGAMRGQKVIKETMFDPSCGKMLTFQQGPDVSLHFTRSYSFFTYANYKLISLLIMLRFIIFICCFYIIIIIIKIFQ